MAIPLLNAAKMLPASLVIKGLEKVSPKFKNFFAQTAAYGYDANMALDYLVNKFGNSGRQQFESQLEKRSSSNMARPDELSALRELKREEVPGKLGRAALAFGGIGTLGAIGNKEQIPQAEQAGEEEQLSDNPIAQASPELDGLLKKLIESGRQPHEAAGIAKSGAHKFGKVIKNLEDTIGMDWFELVRSVYGGQKRGVNLPTTNEMQSATTDQSRSSKVANLEKMISDYLQSRRG